MLNSYAIIILAAFVLENIIDIISSYLNLKALKSSIPSEFSNIYDSVAYGKSQEYVRVKTRFEWFASLYGLIFMLLFWFGRGFNYLDIFIRNFHLHQIITGLLYIGILVMLQKIMSLPLSIYSTFVIEEKFGFNKTTVKTFIADQIKSLVIMAILGGILVAIVLTLFSYGGDLAWVYAWIFTVIFTLFIRFIYPSFIMPWFNKFQPIENGELKDSIMSFARTVDFPLSEIYVMDGSRRSGKTNAFFTGFGKNKRIALFDTLISKHTVPELVAILAHEIGHYKRKHAMIRMAISIIHTGFIFFLISIFLKSKGLFNAFFMDSMSVYAGLIFFMMLLTPIEMVISVLANILSRKFEFQADNFAAVNTRNSETMISALKKLSLGNLTNLTPHPFYVFLKYSHPPMLERIARLRETKQ